MDWLALYIILVKDINIMILPVILMERHDPVITFCAFTCRPTSLLTISLYLPTFVHYTVFHCIEHGARWVQY